MTESLTDLEATYGPAAPFSEHKRGDRVRYLDVSGKERSGRIEWVQAATNAIPLKYIIAPDKEGTFLDFCLPGDILAQEQPSYELTRCVWCGQLHLANQIEHCPLKPD